MVLSFSLLSPHNSPIPYKHVPRTEVHLTIISILNAVTFTLIYPLKYVSYVICLYIFLDMAVVVPLSLISTKNNGNFNSYTYSRVLCILSFWLPSLHKFSFVRIPLKVMSKTEHSSAVLVTWYSEKLGVVMYNCTNHYVLCQYKSRY